MDRGLDEWPTLRPYENPDLILIFLPGSLAVMYLNGMGVKRSEEKGYKLLKKAAGKGSIYAKGNMVKYYYHRKLFTKAAELATELVARSSACSTEYISFGLIYIYNYAIVGSNHY